MDHDIEERIAGLAGSQHGVVSRAQLLHVGLSSGAIGRRLASRRFRSLHRGVYLIGPLRPTHADEMAAALASGRGALLSHVWGTVLLGLRPRPEPLGPIDVSVFRSAHTGRPGIRLHRVKPLADDERTVVEGIPVTAVGRTLVDVASVLGRREIEQCVVAAERLNLITPEELASLPARYRLRPGMATLREVIGSLDRVAFTRSEAENRMLQLLEHGHLPRPRLNVPIGPYELDGLWPREGVAIEVDGWTYHSSRIRFEGDRRKDAWLRARGIQVVRVSWRRLTREPIAVAVEIAQILALARAHNQAACNQTGNPCLPSPTVPA